MVKILDLGFEETALELYSFAGWYYTSNNHQYPSNAKVCTLPYQQALSKSTRLPYQILPSIRRNPREDRKATLLLSLYNIELFWFLCSMTVDNRIYNDRGRFICQCKCWMGLSSNLGFM